MAIVLLISACNTENNFFEKAFYESSSPTSGLTKKDILLSKPKSTSSHQARTNQEHDKKVVASIGSKLISLNELDTSIQLSLFDLEWRKYQLRKEALHSLIAQETHYSNLPDQKTVITLPPPTPPRVGLPKDKRPIMGASNALISIDIFCSYQSSHCARLYPTLTELEQSYSGIIGFRFFDYPQRFHRYGISAANAFRCAADYTQENKTLWAFQSSLYADINQLNNQRYINIAEQLGINSPEFKTCLMQKHHEPEISKDLTFGKEIGLGNVPVVFINGLYVKGANSTEMYRFYIENELKMIGHPITIQQSQLPITLLATTVSNRQGQSTAEIINQNIEDVLRVKIGDQVFPQVNIVDIQANQILINNKGITEFIKIKASHGYQLTDDTHNSTVTGQYKPEAVASHNGDDDEILIDNPQRRTLPVSGETTLSREWVNEQLLDQSSLEKHFYNAEHIVEGHHLVKLDNIDNQRFYTTLGLKTGDVIMRINEQWVHESQNPLWATLQHSDSVTLTVMRKGFPYRYDYHIE